MYRNGDVDVVTGHGDELSIVERARLRSHPAYAHGEALSTERPQAAYVAPSVRPMPASTRGDVEARSSPKVRAALEALAVAARELRALATPRKSAGRKENDMATRNDTLDNPFFEPPSKQAKPKETSMAADTEDRLSRLEKLVAAIAKKMGVGDDDGADDDEARVSAARAKHFAALGREDPEAMMDRVMGLTPSSTAAMSRESGGFTSVFHPMSPAAAKARLAELEAAELTGRRPR